jgi:TRAP-type C4-dicarboxylate transport system permease small subunit
VTRFYAALVRWEARIAGTFLLLMVVLIFTGGAARLAGHPQNWTTDAATCLFAWACFLCADIAWRRDSLMSIDLLVLRLPERARRAVGWANHAIIAAFLLYGIVGGVYLSWVSRARSFQGIPEISYSWVTMAMPVGCLLLLVTTVLKARRGAPAP